MKKYIARLLLLALPVCSCNKNQNATGDHNSGNDSVAADSATDGELSDITEEGYDSLYIVIADTGTDYFMLRSVMFKLSESLQLPIGTMGRFFNVEKNLIALPDNDEDEIYAGEYFPRRFPTENLSLEYLNSYEGKYGDKTIALVTGIFDSESTADNALARLLPFTKAPFKIKANVYLGCMH